MTFHVAENNFSFLSLSFLMKVCRCYFLYPGQDESRGLQIEFRRVLEDGSSAVVNEVAVNAESTDVFQVVCRINNIGDLGKFSIISVFRLQGNTYMKLAQMQNVDETSTDTYRKPVLSPGVSGWTAVGEYTNNPRDSYVGVARQMSAISCNDAVTYRCEVTYTTPDFATLTGVINRTLSVQGNLYLVF